MHCSQALVEQYATSENLEVQGRACEYKRTFGHDTIRSQLFEHMPALDESTYTRRDLCLERLAALSWDPPVM